MVPRWFDLPRRVPDAGGVRGRAARRRAAPLAGPRLPAPGAQPASPRPHASSDTDGAASRRRSTACSPCPGSGRTRRGPCWPSPSSATSPSSTRTSPACWPAGSGRALRRRGRCRRRPTSCVPAGDGWVWNQALMDLGATVVRPALVPAVRRARSRPTCGWHAPVTPTPIPASGRLECRGRSRASRDRTARAGAAWSTRSRRIGSTVRDASRVAGLAADPGRAATVVGSLIADGLVAESPTETLVLGGAEKSVTDGHVGASVERRG